MVFRTTSICMHFLQKLPDFLLRHKSLSFLHKTRLVTNPILASFNGGAKAYLDLSDPEPRIVFIKQVFEPDFFTIANAILPPNGYFFDLGANLGLCSFGLIQCKPKTFCHLFEVNARLTALLKKSCSLYPDSCFVISNFCVTDEPGQTIFHIEEKQSGQSHVATDSDSGESVPNLLLDHYCKEKKVNFVDFAKVDLEGHELPALKGWRKDLSEHKVRAIYIEIIPENQARYGRPTNAPSLSWNPLVTNSIFARKMTSDPLEVHRIQSPFLMGLSLFLLSRRKSILKILQLMRWL